MYVCMRKTEREGGRRGRGTAKEGKRKGGNEGID